MNMIEFFMCMVFIFQGHYYEYGCNIEGKQREPSIGGYSSAFLTDLATAYVMKALSEIHILAKLDGIYQDVTIVEITGNRTKSDVRA